MRVEEELVTFLQQYLNASKNVLRLENVGRYIEIIAYYYGFRDAKWPTLEETAKKFKIRETTTRERIRQLVEEFRCVAPLSNLPALVESAQILCDHDAISVSDYQKLLIDANLMDESCNIRGLLNYMQDFGLSIKYDIYSPFLQRITRGYMNGYEENFLFTQERAEETLLNYRKVRSLPGLLGIATFSQVREKIPGISDFQEKLLKGLIKAQNAWVLEEDGEFWFTYEDRENTITNFSRKLFGVIDRCNPKTLAIVYRNALDRRDNRFSYPPEKIIETYLTTSKHFNLVDGELIFLEDTIPLVDIEQEIVSYLRDKNFVYYPEFNAFLAKKYTKPYIDKVILHSSLVYVDKSGGRDHYKYSIVSSRHLQRVEKAEDRRYARFKNQMKELCASGTSEPLETARRREQAILHNWLFEGKEKEECAICGRSFSISALVTAHKKPRSKCSEMERVDPYIVMPICVFGCDFLYEKNFIWVDAEGIIRVNLSKENDTTEFAQASLLEGKPLSEQWFRGPKNYFDKLM